MSEFSETMEDAMTFNEWLKEYHSVLFKSMVAAKLEWVATKQPSANKCKCPCPSPPFACNHCDDDNNCTYGH